MYPGANDSRTKSADCTSCWNCSRPAVSDRSRVTLRLLVFHASQRETAVGAWGVVDEWSAMPSRVSLRRLDLDHVGAKVGEQLAGKVAALVGKIEDSVRGKQIWLVGHGASSVTNLASTAEGSEAAYAASSGKNPSYETVSKVGY